MDEGKAFPVKRDDGGYEEGCAKSRDGGKIPFALFPLLLYVALGYLLYSDVILKGPFLFDDYEYIVENPLIRSLSYFKNMTDPRHLGYLSFAINYALGGENPFGFHLFNTLIHIINATLVFFLIRLVYDIAGEDVTGPREKERRQRGTYIAFLSGLVFLVHPVETQAVSYITQRFTSLSALFYLLSVFLFLSGRVRLEKGPSTGGYTLYVLSVLSAVFAMKTKEIAFTVPFTIALFEYVLFRNSLYGKRRFIYLVPFAATLIIIPISLYGPELGLSAPGVGIDEVTRRDKLFDLYQRSPYEYLFTQSRVVVTYIRLLLLPIGQSAIYDYKASHSIFEPAVIASMLFLTSLISAAFFLLWKARSARAADAADFRLVSLGVLWFFITISIESSVIPIKDVIFEHRVYLPSVGFFAASSVLLMRLLDRFRGGWAEVSGTALLVCLIAVPLSFATYHRNEVWTNDIRFWDDIVKKTGKAIGYNNRGTAYLKEGKLELALSDLNKTIGFFPRGGDRMAWENADFTPGNMAKTYISRGQLYVRLGEVAKANADFDTAKQIVQFFRSGKGRQVNTETATEGRAGRRAL